MALLKLSIKSKIAFLTTFMITLTLSISLFISYQNTIREKEAHATKLMINIAKQIALLKKLDNPISDQAFDEYVQKTLHSVLSRKGLNIQTVYVLAIGKAKQVETFLINQKLLQLNPQEKDKLLQDLLSSSSPNIHNIKKVSINLSLNEKDEKNEKIEIGFSLFILQSAILGDLFFHLFLGAMVIFFGLLISLLLANMMTSPLLRLMKALQSLRQGNLDIQVHVDSGDEIQDLAENFNQMVLGLKEREMIKNAFSRYASEEIVQKILKGEVRPLLEGSLKPVTVLFADIRNFTEITHHLDPQKVVQLLNIFFNSATNIVSQYEGLLDKYTGDEIMAVYGAPLSHSDDPWRALRSAIDMHSAIYEVNQHLSELDLPEIHIGIGIHTGKAIAGNIGTEKRMNYTVSGSDVNIAARIVNLAKADEICISEATYLAVQNQLDTKAEPEEVHLKGIHKPIKIFRLACP